MTKQYTTDAVLDVQLLFSFLQATPNDLPAIFVCTKEYLEANVKSDDKISLEQFPELFEECEIEYDDDCVFYRIKGDARFRFYELGCGAWGVEEFRDGEFDCNFEIDEPAFMAVLGQAGLLKDDSILGFF